MKRKRISTSVDGQIGAVGRDHGYDVQATPGQLDSNGFPTALAKHGDDSEGL